MLARAALVLVSFALGCSQPAASVEPQTLAPPVEAGAAATASAPASATAAASSATPAASASAPAEPTGFAERPPREGAPGSTRGTIACGTTRCTAPAEVCRFDEPTRAWRCEVPKTVTAPPGEELPPPEWFACDDGTDCPNGETCCSIWDGASGEHGACVKRQDVGRRCRAEVCLEGGARCPPGKSCVDGSCDAPDGPATCAGKRRCPSDQPFCVKSKAPGGFECAAAGSAAYVAARGEDRWTCTRQSDCNAGETCSFVFGEIEHEVRTFCSLYQPGYMGSLLCELDRPDFCGGDPDCSASMACRADDGAPPWVGVWGSK